MEMLHKLIAGDINSWAAPALASCCNWPASCIMPAAEGDSWICGPAPAVCWRSCCCCRCWWWCWWTSAAAAAACLFADCTMASSACKLATCSAWQMHDEQLADNFRFLTRFKTTCTSFFISSAVQNIITRIYKPLIDLEKYWAFKSFSSTLILQLINNICPSNWFPSSSQVLAACKQRLDTLQENDEHLKVSVPHWSCNSSIIYVQAIDFRALLKCSQHANKG